MNSDALLSICDIQLATPSPPPPPSPPSSSNTGLIAGIAAAVGPATTGSQGSAGAAAAATAAAAVAAAVAAADSDAWGGDCTDPKPSPPAVETTLAPAGASAETLPPTPGQLSGGEAQPHTSSSLTASGGAAPVGDAVGSLDSKAGRASAASSGAALSPHGSGSRTSGLEMRPWEVQYSSLQIIKSVGEGSFGKVYLARWHGIDVACKILLAGHVGGPQHEHEGGAVPTISPSLLQKLEEEAGLMLSLRFPHVVNFYEFCQLGSLSDLLTKARSDPAAAAALTWPRRLTLALDAALGMLYLHSRSSPIVHRDLKSPNLLVDENWRAKVADFNLSRILEDSSRSSSLAAMNPRWLAPEVMQGEHASMASDVFSYAVVLWELLTFHLPWGPANPWQLVSLVVGGGRLEVPPRGALPGADTPTFTGLEAYLALMRRCWAQNPCDRPSFS
ncbi:Serine threonine-kinase CTR1 [Micractinium conductrix]|uniref:Serine threonine-kinase CTR1 n=1 Tax=Micractinium conductrix TaxID=554055 RepID=A0A2P6VJB6_9CHLO|nr:Serine threonine-kinase CTR1 [Micractinium conductrix]|eukprot:PSC74168.1 Serine threonine-kinase CTR1 [Micractinium conductrix]